MDNDSKDTQEQPTTDGKEKKYVNGVCLNCGSKLALPEEEAQKLIEQNHPPTA